MGAVIDSDAFHKIVSYIAIGAQRRPGRARRAARRAESGRRLFPAPDDHRGCRAPNARIAQEEIFGPVLAVLRADDFEHALEIANGTAYGLTGALYSNSRDHLERARHEFHVGNLYLNRKCTGALVDVQPFGGFNLSGTNSKAGGRDYLGLFLQAKSVCERW